VAQYRAFLDDRTFPDSKKPDGFENWSPDQTTSPTDRHPAQLVSWNDAVRFCNWLSEKEGLTPCYRREREDLSVDSGDGHLASVENWICDFDAQGFRLPTEAEWEIACRAGSTTRYCFGDDSKFLESYGLSSNYRSMSSSPLRAKMPNSFGMFDMHGNVWEWCHDWHSYLLATDLVDPTGPQQPDAGVFGRVYRGGGIATLSGDTDSSSRGYAPPDTRYSNLGFRIARTINPIQSPPSDH
jgi:formylglycine-generating enzyme required for sulfatase activity